jgi:hypothetical protein
MGLVDIFVLFSLWWKAAEKQAGVRRQAAWPVVSTHPKAGATNRSRRPNASDHVSKQHSDICLNDDTARLANDADGRNGVAAIPSRTQVDRVVREATDGYDHDLLCALQMARIDMAGVDASRAHGFADLIVVEKRPQPGGEPCPSFA